MADPVGLGGFELGLDQGDDSEEHQVPKQKNG